MYFFVSFISSITISFGDYFGGKSEAMCNHSQNFIAILYVLNIFNVIYVSLNLYIYLSTLFNITFNFKNFPSLKKQINE